MSVERLIVSGYKSLKSVTWDFGSLNLLIGPNGSGKSNLIRCLALLQKAMTGQALPSAIQEAGGIQSLLWDNRSSEVSWQLLHTAPSFGHTRATPPKYLLYELTLAPLCVRREWVQGDMRKAF
jgi:predicted ATPase